MSYPTVYLRDIAPKPNFLASWDRYKYRNAHWLAEMVAEMIGVFFYVYAGVGANAGFILGNILGQEGLGALLNVGFAFSFGITVAIAICGPTSGGHFNPGVTLAFVAYKGFSKTKAIRYIVAQILGAFIACLLVYVQWKDVIVEAEEVLMLKGVYDSEMFTPNGPAAVFAFFVNPGTNLNRALLNEFVTDVYIGLVIWGCLDPTNHLIPPSVGPWMTGFAYGVAIWGFAPTAISTNTARDVGSRLMALSVWGMGASGGPYAAISSLTNIPATFFAAFLYEVFLGSGARTLTPGHIEWHGANNRFLQDIQDYAHRGSVRSVQKSGVPSGGSADIDGKETAEQFETAVPA